MDSLIRDFFLQNKRIICCLMHESRSSAARTSVAGYQQYQARTSRKRVSSMSKRKCATWDRDFQSLFVAQSRTAVAYNNCFRRGDIRGERDNDISGVRKDFPRCPRTLTATVALVRCCSPCFFEVLLQACVSKAARARWLHHVFRKRFCRDTAELRMCWELDGILQVRGESYLSNSMN